MCRDRSISSASCGPPGTSRRTGRGPRAGIRTTRTPSRPSRRRLADPEDVVAEASAPHLVASTEIGRRWTAASTKRRLCPQLSIRRYGEARMWLKPTVLAFAVISIAAPVLASDPLPRAAPGEVGLSPRALARIGEVLKADVDKGRIPGAVVAIARKGKLAYFEAFGFRDKTAGVPMTTDAIFSIASMTKPMTSV